jgi:hypothetical protein
MSDEAEWWAKFDARQAEQAAKDAAFDEELARQAEERQTAQVERQADLAAMPAGKRARREALGTIKGIAILLAIVLVVPVSWEISMTLSRYSGNDFDNAKYTGQALVESCERQGPIGIKGGIGFWYKCVVNVQWDDGTVDKGHKISEPGFFTEDESGRTITIGYTGGSRSGNDYARPDLPRRYALDVLGLIFAGVAVLLLTFVGAALWVGVRKPKKAASR